MNKKFIWAFLNAPLVSLLGYALTHLSDHSTILVLSGHIALIFYLTLTSLNPLISAFPTLFFLKQANRYRPAIGVACFSYVLLHFLSYFMKTMKVKTTLLFAFLHPYIFPGTLAFLIFMSMAFTSNKFSIQKLGFLRWKRLHKLTYISQFLILAHILLLGGPKTKLYILPFGLLFYFQWKRRQKRNSDQNQPKSS